MHLTTQLHLKSSEFEKQQKHVKTAIIYCTALKFCYKLRPSHFIYDYESVKESFVRLLWFRVALGVAMSLESK